MKITNDLVGSLWIHSQKAIKRGEPANRILPDDGIQDGYLLAWKCTRDPGTHIKHPAFSEPVSLDQPLIFTIGPATNGSVPTALFKPDSLYCQIW